MVASGLNTEERRYMGFCIQVGIERLSSQERIKLSTIFKKWLAAQEEGGTERDAE